MAVGCSFTQGQGLERESLDPLLWVNQIFPEDYYQVDNVAKTGANNHWIFLECACKMASQHYDVVLVAWTSIPRFNYHVGLEMYSVETLLHNRDVNINNHVTVSGKWLKSVGDSLRRIHNDHWDLLDLVKYVNILTAIAHSQRSIQIFFVNSLGPWCPGYFTKKSIDMPSDLTDYEQDLLQVQTRDDKEILQLYNMVHTHYENYGGIKQNHWLNLYSSLYSMQIDDASATDAHPGYKSQNKYAEILLPVLHSKLHA